MTNKFVRSLLAIYLGSAFSVGVVTLSSDAQAWWTRSSASSCVELAGNNNATFNPGCNNSLTNSKIYTCNVPDSSATPKASITLMNVHVEQQASGLMSASRCVQFRDVKGAACGQAASTTANGTLALSPTSFSDWITTNYGYVMVLLSKSASSSNQSCVKGFLTSG
jgi:hypothetical protein